MRLPDLSQIIFISKQRHDAERHVDKRHGHGTDPEGRGDEDGI